MNDYLTAGDIAQITGVPMQTINEWSAKGVLQPTQNGMGQGRNRLFTLIDAVALKYAYVFRQEGIGLDLTRNIVDTIKSFDEDGLAREFAAGRRCVFLVPGTKIIAPPEGVEPLPRVFDLQITYRDVKKAVENMHRERAEARAKKLRHERATTI